MVLVGDPGDQGPIVAGTQGVGTPSAAAVSVAHTPKGVILAIGAKSMMVAASWLEQKTVWLLVTMIGAGMAPMLQ